MKIHLIVGTLPAVADNVLKHLKANLVKFSGVTFDSQPAGDSLVNVTASGPADVIVSLNDELYFNAGYYYHQSMGIKYEEPH